MKWLLLIGALLFAQPASAAIAFVRAASHNCFGGGVTSCAVTISSTGGDALVVFAMLSNTDTSIGVTDSASNAYTAQVNSNFASDNVLRIIFTSPASASAVTSVTISWTGSDAFPNVVVAEYSGVAAFGNTNVSGATATTSFSMSVTTQANNNWITGAWQDDSGNGTYSTGTGTSRCIDAGNSGTTTCAAAGGSQSIQMLDNTSATAGSVSLASTVLSSTDYYGAAIELCLSNPCAAAGAVVFQNQRTRRGH